MTLDGDIRAHYDSVDEQGRLSQGAGALERERTREILTRWLPPAPSVVLDVGGGPGAHALWLAQRGYEVHLVEPVPRHREQARQASSARADGRLASVSDGDARRLERPDGSCDAVLMLGPLYHLTARAERVAALAEARRVLRAGGVAVLAIISRFASLLDGLRHDRLDDPDFSAIVRSDLTDGQHRNPTRHPAYFTTAYFHRPEEVSQEAAEAGLAFPELLAVEGPAWLLGDLEPRWDDPARREGILAAIRAIEGEPSLWGASAHLLGLAKRA